MECGHCHKPITGGWWLDLSIPHRRIGDTCEVHKSCYKGGMSLCHWSQRSGKTTLEYKVGHPKYIPVRPLSSPPTQEDK